MDVEVVRLSSRGQLVIPESMREELNLKTGQKLLLVEKNGMITMRQVEKIDDDIIEEIELMALASEGWAEIESGKSTTVTKEKFLEELAAW